MINPQYNINNQYYQNQYQNQKPQLNIIFKTTQGIRQNFRFYYGTTINQVLITYLNKIGRPDLINKQSDEIYFTYNSSKLNFNDQRKIENAFNNADPSIEVHYTEKMYKTININNSRNDRNNFFANIRRTKTISDLSNNNSNTIYNESENDKLKRQLKQFQVFASQNINNNNPQNMMPLIGGVNFNMNYNNRITFVFIDGSQCIIFINNITKLSEVLQELRIQRENLPNINNLRFVNNGIDITQSFQQDCLIRKLNLRGPILVLLQRRN